MKTSAIKPSPQQCFGTQMKRNRKNKGKEEKKKSMKESDFSAPRKNQRLFQTEINTK